MARQPNQNPGSDRGLQAAQPSAQPDDTETPEPDFELAQANQAAPAKPALSAEEQIKALQNQINALMVANQPPVQEEPAPGSTIRPERGPRHLEGHPIFNAGRPTGRAG